MIITCLIVTVSCPQMNAYGSFENKPHSNLPGKLDIKSIPVDAERNEKQCFHSNTRGGVVVNKTLRAITCSKPSQSLISHSL